MNVKRHETACVTKINITYLCWMKVAGLLLWYMCSWCTRAVGSLGRVHLKPNGSGDEIYLADTVADTLIRIVWIGLIPQTYENVHGVICKWETFTCDEQTDTIFTWHSWFPENEPLLFWTLRELSSWTVPLSGQNVSCACKILMALLSACMLPKGQILFDSNDSVAFSQSLSVQTGS